MYTNKLDLITILSVRIIAFVCSCCDVDKASEVEIVLLLSLHRPSRLFFHQVQCWMHFGEYLYFELDSMILSFSFFFFRFSYICYPNSTQLTNWIKHRKLSSETNPFNDPRLLPPPLSRRFSPVFFRRQTFAVFINPIYHNYQCSLSTRPDLISNLINDTYVLAFAERTLWKRFHFFGRS